MLTQTLEFLYIPCTCPWVSTDYNSAIIFHGHNRSLITLEYTIQWFLSNALPLLSAQRSSNQALDLPSFQLVPSLVLKCAHAIRHKSHVVYSSPAALRFCNSSNLEENSLNFVSHMRINVASYTGSQWYANGKNFSSVLNIFPTCTSCSTRHHQPLHFEISFYQMQ